MVKNVSEKSEKKERKKFDDRMGKAYGIQQFFHILVFYVQL